MDSLNKLSAEKQELIRLMDSGDITPEEFFSKKKDIEERILIERARQLGDLVEDNTTPIIMPRKLPKQRRGPKVKEDSYISLIVKSLMHPTTKSVEDVFTVVNNVKPGRDRDKLIAHIKRIIYNVRKKTGTRWEMYEWDKEKFLLIKK